MPLKELLAALPELAPIYKKMFLAMPKGQPDNFLKLLIKADKNENPLIYGPLAVLFNTTPKTAHNLLLSNSVSDDNLYLAAFIQAFQHQLINWIDNNRPLYKDLIDVSKEFSFLEEGENLYIVGINEITEEEEQAYLDVKEPVERSLRLKALAAVEMIALYERITHTFKHKGELAAKAAMIYTFLYFRSFAQFTSTRAIEDGIRTQAGRRTKTPKKKPLLALKEEYQKRFPEADNKELWQEIYNALSSGNYFEYDEFWVEFKSSSNTDDIYDGEIVQKTEGKLDVSWKFSTFRRKKVALKE